MAVLRSVQSTLQHLPSELMDPTVIALEAERATAMTALNLAEAIIVGFEDMNNWMSSGLQKLTKGVGSSKHWY